jgi:hypothetical protein
VVVSASPPGADRHVSVSDITGFAQTLPQRSLDRGRLATRLEAENPTIGIVGCCARAASGQAVRLALNPTSICGLPSRFPWATARLKAAGIAAVRDFDPADVRSGSFSSDRHATNAPGMSASRRSRANFKASRSGRA